uniref:Uncharacterized protein n=1 Tax=Populus trichocarpa TaxID=3694 RepID=A9PH49_POPTR|nr:unknown [Populus trichocarpa]
MYRVLLLFGTLCVCVCVFLSKFMQSFLYIFNTKLSTKQFHNLQTILVPYKTELL